MLLVVHSYFPLGLLMGKLDFGGGVRFLFQACARVSSFRVKWGAALRCDIWTISLNGIQFLGLHFLVLYIQARI